MKQNDKIYRTGEIAFLLGLSLKTIQYRVENLGIIPSYGKCRVLLFNYYQFELIRDYHEIIKLIKVDNRFKDTFESKLNYKTLSEL